MQTLSTQVHELEKKAERLEHDNENLRVMLYRMIATHGNTFEPVPYVRAKPDLIKACSFIISTENTINCFLGSEYISPNNSPEYLSL
jgi:hypothetical protein